MNFNLGPKNFFKNDHSSNEWIPLSLAAKLTPYSSEYLSLLARKKKLSAKKIDNTWYTTKAIVDEYMHRQMVRAQIQNGSLDSGKIKPIFERASEVAPASVATSKISSPVFAEEVFVKEKVRPSFAEFPHPNFASVVKPETTTEKNVHIVERGEEKSFFMDEFKKIGESLSTLNSKIEKTQEDKTIEDNNKKIKSAEKVLPLIPPLAPKVTIVPEIKEKIVEAPKPFDISAVVKKEVSSQLEGSVVSPITVVSRPMTTGSKIKFGALTLAALALFIILPIPVVFGMFDTSLHAVKDWMKDSQTVLGFRPGTHANELLLLNDKGEISILGSIETEGQLKSFAKQGIPPLVVTSSTTVANLSVQYLNGLSSDDLTALITDTVIKKISSSGILVSASGAQTTNITLGTTEENLDKRLNELANLLKSEIYRVSSNATTNYNNNFSAIALTQRIDNLSNVRINNAIITNSTFSGTTGTFETLTVTGTGSFTTLSSTGFTTQSLTATGISNLATTTIASLTVTNLSSFQDVTFANATGTSATTTNFFASILHAATGVIDTFSSSVAAFTDYTATNGTTTNATSTNLFAQNITAGNITATGTASFATTTTTNLIVTASSTFQDFTFNNATGTSATTTNFFATTASSTNLFASLLNVGNNSLVVSSNGNVGVGTSSPTDVFSVDGPIYLSEIVPPSVLDNRLYNNAGVLYFGGVAVGSGLGCIDWSYFNGSGTRLATTTNQVLIGAVSTSTSAKLEVVGDTYISGLTNLFGGVISNAASSTISNLSVVNSTTTSATSTNLFSTLFRATTGVIDNFSSSFASITEYTAVNSTTTNATTTNLFAQNITAGNITATGTAAFGTTTLTNLAVTNISTSTFNGGLTIGGSQFVVQSSTGNVGIGTTSPVGRLDITNPVLSSPSLVIGDPLTSGVNRFSIGTRLGSGSASGLAFSPAGGVTELFTSAVAAQLYAYNAAGTKTIQLRTTGDSYLNGGNVGIGTTSPFAKLSVAGDAYIGGNLTATGTVSFLGGLTSLSNLWVTGSSTLQDFTFNNATGTSATTTNFFTSILRATSGVIDTFSSSVAAFTDYTAVNSTTTNATTTNLFSTTASSTNLFASLLNVGSNALVVTSNGKVGIGTSSPLGKLDIAGANSLGNAIVIGRGAGANSGVGAALYAIDQASVQFAATNGGTVSVNSDTFVAGSAFVGNLIRPTVTGGTISILDRYLGTPTITFTGTTQNVGIGTTSPFAKLSVAGDAYIGGNLTATGTLTVSGAITAPYFTATSLTQASTFPYASTTALTSSGSAYLATAGGNVGIGTANPAVKLDIGGGSNYTNTTGVNQFFSPTGKIIQVRDANQSSLNLISDIDTTGAVLGAIAFSRSGGQADSHVNVAGINATQVGTGSLAGGTLQFWTKSNGGSVTEPRMIIDNAGNVGVGTTTPGSRLAISGGVSIGVNYGVAAPTNGLIVEGNVGIGTSSPTQLLHVVGSSNRIAWFSTSNAGGIPLVLENTNNAIGQNISLDFAGMNSLGGSNSYGRIASVVTDNTSGAVAGDLIFSSRSALTGLSEKMRVTGLGNVGIGTTSPFAKLSVAGDAYIGGNLTATGTVTISGLTTLANLLVTGSSTLQNFTFVNATGTSATTTNFYSTTASSTNLFSSLLNVGGSSLVVSANGNVGVGTSSPSAKLTIISSDGNQKMYFDGASFSKYYSTETNPRFVIEANWGMVDGINTVFTGIRSGASNVTGSYAMGNASGNGHNPATGIFVSDGTSYISRLTIDNSGNVGIGTTTPFVKLSVAGDAYIGGNLTATGTVSFQNFTFVNATGTSATTTNFYSTTASSTNLFSSLLNVGGSSLVVAANGNVGVGTSSPSAKLQIGSIATSPVGSIETAISLGNTYSATAGSNLKLKVYEAGSVNYGFGVSSGSLDIVAGQTTGVINFYTNGTGGTSKMIINASGNVGIGTTSPFAQLSVQSTAGGSTPLFTIASSTNGTGTTTALHVTNNGNVGIGTNNPLGRLQVQAASGQTTWQVLANNDYNGVNTGTALAISSGAASGNTYVNLQALNTAGSAGPMVLNGGGGLVGIGTTTPWAKLAVNPVAGDTNQFVVGSSSATSFVINPAGKVGIGTSTPFTNLSVVGSGYFSGALGIGTTNSIAGTLETSGNIGAGSQLLIRGLLNCSSGSQALKTDGAGQVSCGSITALGGTSAGGWTWISPNQVNLATTSDYVVLGVSTSTPYAKLFLSSGAPGTTTLAVSAVSSQTADILHLYNNTLALDTVFTASGLLGLGTTTPSSNYKLSVVGGAYFTGNGYFGGDISGVNLTSSGSVNFSGLGRDMIITTDSNGTLVASSTPQVAAIFATSTTATSTFAGAIKVNTGNNFPLILSGLENSPSAYAGIWLGQNTASAGNYAFLGSAGQTFFNVANTGTADLEFRVGNITRFTVGNNGAGVLLTPNTAPTKPFQVNLTSGGTSAFSVETSGLVGVGTSSPFAQLSVQATAGGSAPLFTIASSTSGAGTSTAFHVASNGNVGIGTNVPSRSLDIVATDTFSTGSLTGGPMISLYDNGGFAGARRFTLQNTRDATNNALLFNLENDAGSSLVRNVLTILSNGNVGIGTTSPYAKLSVAGPVVAGYFTATSTTATSTLGYSISLDNGCYAIAGVCVASSNSTFGGGSAGAMTYWINSNTLGATTSPTVGYLVATSTTATSTFAGGMTVDTNSLVVDYSSNNVGIGTTVPGGKLEVMGITGSPASSGVTQNGIIRMRNSNSHTGTLDFGTLTSSPFSSWIQATDASNLALTYPVAINPNGGNVGIGTTTPAATLHVRNASVGGSIRLEGATNYDTSFRIFEGDTNVFSVNYSPLSDRTDFQNHVSGDDLRMITNFGNFYMNTGNGAGTSVFTVLADNGNVGIGSTTPGYKLSVAGSAYFDGGNITVSTITATSSVSALSYNVLSAGIGTGYQLGGTSVLNYVGGVTRLNDLGGGISLRTNSTDRLYVDTAGLVGIGDISPTYKLDVTGNARFTSFVDASHFVATSTTATSTFAGGLTVGSTNLSVPASGNIGIGTANPAVKLDIGGGANYTNTTGVNQFFSPTGKIIQVRDANQSSLNLISDIDTTGAVLGAIAFSRSGGQADSHVNVAGINATQVGTGSLAGGTLQFWTKSNGGSVTEPRMIIDNAGNVGVGTIAPNSFKLQIAGSVGPETDNSYDLGSYLLRFRNLHVSNIFSSSSPTFSSLGKNMVITTDGNGTLVASSTPQVAAIFATSTTATSTFAGGMTVDTNSLVVDYSTSRVGIGTTTPLSKLAVSGSASIGANYNIAAPTNGLIVEGNVGIGTNAPASTLAVVGNASIGTTEGSFTFTPNYNYNGTNVGPSLAIADNDSTTRWASLRLQTAGGTWEMADMGGNFGFLRGTNTRVVVSRGDSSGSTLSAYNDNNVNLFNVNSTGNTGFNVSSPANILDVGTGSFTTAKTADFSGLNITNTATSSSSFIKSGARISSTGSWTGSNIGLYVTAVSGGTNNYDAIFNGGGNVGIGTTTPDTKLTITAPDNTTFLNTTNSSASGATQFKASLSGFGVDFAATRSASGFFTFTTASAERMRITSTGNVGIGSTTPMAKLSVVGTGASANTIITGNADYFGSITSTGAGTRLLGISTTNDVFVGGIDTAATGKVTVRQAGLDRIVIDTSGNVGIGTTTPNAKLQVNGQVTVGVSGRTNFNPADSVLDVYAPAKFVYIDSDVGGEWGLKFRGASGSAFTDIFKYTANGTTGEIQIGGVYATYFPTFYSGNAERMRITTAGNVGIGTTSPFAKLSVAGDAYIGGNLTATGTVTISGLTTLANLLVTGSSTLQNFTFVNATGTSATTTNFYSTTASSTNLFSTLLAVGGNKLVTTAGGNVGIGTANPTVNVDVNGTGDTYVRVNSPDANTSGFLYNKAGVQKWFTYVPASSNDLRFYDGSDRLTIQNGGNVGIGTTNPEGKLNIFSGNAGTIVANTASDDLVIENSGDVGAHFISPDANAARILFGTPSDASIGQIQTFYNSGNPYLSLRTQNVNGYLLFSTGNDVEAMRITSSGKLGLGTTTPTVLLTVGSSTPDSIASTNYYNSAYISGDLEVDGTIYGTTAPVYSSLGKHMVITTDGSGTLVASSTPQVAAIFATSTTATSTFAGGITGPNNFTVQSSSGNVGVGTANPGAKFEVVGTSLFTTGLATFNGSDGSGASIRTVSGIKFGGNSDLIGASSDYGYFTIGAGTDIRFTDNAGINPKMTILSGGNVGIGTTSPSAKLTVYGDTLIEGTSRYLNFGTSTGSGGYGFRDNAGTLEFKNLNGTWQAATTATSGPSFYVHKNEVDQIITINTDILLTWSTERFDTNNNFTNNKFTPTVPGKYMITGSVSCGTDSTTQVCGVRIYKNGSAYAINDNREAYGQALVTTMIEMNGTTDYLEVYGYTQNSSTGTISGTNNRTYFTGALIAPVNATAGGWQNDGTQSFLADSTDLVGIGTSTPWAKLSINPNGILGPSFVIGSSTKTDFIVTNGGNVGIGTTAFSEKLSIRGSAGLGINGASNADSILSLNSDIGYSWQLYQTDIAASGRFGIKYLQGSLEALSILRSGNVGIGTTSPASLLQLAGTDASNPSITITSNLGTRKVYLGDPGGDNDGSLALYDTSGTIRTFLRGGPQDSYLNTNGGNVGIGTASPGGKLHVKGLNLFVGANSSATGGGGSTSAVDVRFQGGGTEYGMDFIPDSDNTVAILFNNAAVTAVGSVSITNVGTTYNTTSDVRLKENIIDTAMGIDELRRISVKDYNFISDVNKETTQGFIAQELYNVYPYAVKVGGDDANKNPWGVDYGRLTPLIVKAVQELDDRTSFISSASTSTTLTILADGNVGIGTTTPNRALSVAGDVGATAFVNTSTKTSKKDISYATVGSAEDMFNQLVNLKIATYRYNAEEDNAPLRLGFIAEDAQTTAPEILSPDGKGVDLYKLATFTLSGVQTLAGKVDAISGSLASATSTIATATWAIDQTTGATMLTTSADINLGGKSLLGALSIGGADGKWSIDENGKFVGEELNVNKVNAGEISVARDLNVAGNVGIGIATTSTSNTTTGATTGAIGIAPTAIARLTVQNNFGGSTSKIGTSSPSALTFATLDTQGNASFVVANDGRVGLGTSAPKSALSISSPSPRLTLTDTASVIDSISGGNVGVGTTTKDWFVESRNGTFSIGEISGLSDNSSSSTENIYLSISATSTPVLTFAGDIKANIISAKAIISDSICVASFCDSFGSRTISSDKVALAESGIAEHFADLSAGDVEVGDIVAMSATTTPNTIVSAEATTTSAVLVRADKTNATSVVGIANVAGLTFSSTSTSPSVVFSGKTIVKVSTEGGVIKPGDRITLSSVPGVGMKATTSSQTIGIALGLFDGTQSATSTVTSVNVDGTFVYQGSVAVAVSVGWTRLDGALTNATSTSATLAVDSVSGRVLSQGVLDMSGFAVENVSAITSSSGTWSIDASGKLLADNIEVRGGIKVGSPERRSGITMYDEEFGTPYCLTISAGLPKTTSGECQDSSTATQTSSSSVVGAIVDAISGSVNALTEPTTTYTAPTTDATTATTTDATTTPVDTTVVDTTATTTPTDTTTATTTETITTTVVDTTATSTPAI